jgi:hypothetical protein
MRLFLVIFSSIYLSVSYSMNNIDKTTNSNKSLWTSIKGVTPHDALFFEMLTLHLKPSSLKIRNWHTQLLALQYKGFFVGTFINSFYNRTYTLGLARQVYSKESGYIYYNAGYRLGLLYGYTDHQAPLSNISPVIPLIQPYINISIKDTFGLELSIAADPSISLFLYF